MTSAVTWIAIDDEGCIGTFDATIGSVVPQAAFPGGRAMDRFSLDVLRAGRVVAIGRPPPPTPAPAWGERALVVVDPARAADVSYRSMGGGSRFESTATTRLVVVRSAQPRVLAAIDPLDAPALRALQRDPTIVRALGESRLRAWLDGERDSGVFRWAGGDPRGPARYVRDASPATPIRIHELPMDAQLELRAVRLPLRYEHEEEIFIDDHLAKTVILGALPEPFVPAVPPIRGVPSARAPRAPVAVAFGAALAVHVLIAWLLR